MSAVFEPGHLLPSRLREENFAAHIGVDYFKALAGALYSSFDADFVLAVLIGSSADTKPRVLSFQGKDAARTAEPYPFGQAVTDGLTSEQALFIPTGAQARFPDDAFLAAHEVDGLAAIGIHGKEENGFHGAIIVLRREGFEKDSPLPEAIATHATRLRSEFRHYATQSKLKETISQALLLNYSKSMFMANIGHELRTPIGAMTGYAALIRDGELDWKTTRSYASQICASGESLLTLIGDVMSLAMLEISDETATKESFDLMDIARTGRRLIEQQAAAKNLALKSTPGADALIVRGDAAHTKKALMNLLTNAVKYTSTGTIEINVSSQADGGARLSVIDTGVGMTAEELEEACAPLGTFTKAYDMHQEGAGLGLPITVLLMERQGGKLEIESVKGQGTRAHLTFPATLVEKGEGDFI